MPADPILRAFADLASRRGSAPLVASPTRVWSVGDLDRAAGALALRLERKGCGRGELVGLAAAPGPAFAAGWLALRRLGAVPVLCDSARPTPDRLAALDQLGVAGFLAAAEGWPADAAAWDFDRRRPPGGREGPAAGDPAWGAVKLTSGTTGAARGVAVASAALAADDDQLARSMGLTADDRIVAAVPLSHSYGFASVLLPALVRGSLLVVADDRGPFASLAAARALEATVLPTVPAWLGGYVRLASPPAWPPSLRLVIAAGAPLPAETARAFRVRTGMPVHVFYGASECGGIAYDRRGDAAERGTVGAAVDGVRLELDAESGLLVVTSAAVAETYLGEPGPGLAGGRFVTADRARLEDGEVRLLGRADDVVFVRGKNVHPREVESVLAAVPGVEEACVFGLDGPDGPRSVLAAVVAAPGGGVDRERLVTWCRERLAEHKVPRSLSVVAELPRTGRGKLDRSALAALAG